jgi:hypothetical protein
VVRVGANTEMETFLAGNLDEIPVYVRWFPAFFVEFCSLVGANAGGFEGFRAQLFVLVGDHVDAEREIVDIGALATEVENTDLRVGH